MLLTISNLYPRPDRPQCGMYNAQLFKEFSQLTRICNICPVPSWQAWRWREIRKWRDPLNMPFETCYVPVPYVPVVGRRISWLTYLAAMKRLKDVVAAADAVLAAWLYPDAVAAARLADMHGVPCWIMVLGSDTFHLEDPVRRDVILDACNRSQGIICVCRALADKMVSAGVPGDKVHVVPNGVDVDLFHYRPKDSVMDRLRTESSACTDPQSAIRNPKSRKTVLFVGNLVHVKGADALLNAWSVLKSGERQGAPSEHVARLVVIGDGPMRGRLVRRARALGIADSVDFPGARPHSEIALWMNVADCLCLASRHEGMPNAVIEALASGLPVVATDVGACRELLARESCCQVVPADVPEQMARALGEILNLPVDRPGFALAQANRFSWSRQAGTIMDLVTGQAQVA